MEKIKLGKYCVNKIDNVPAKDDYDIDYIDISSVDNVTKKVIGYSTYDIAEAPSRAKQLLKKNDVLVSTVRPNLNAVALCDIETENVLVGSTGFCVLRGNEKVNSKYLFYFCQSGHFVGELMKVATGASYPAVSKNDVKNVLIPKYQLEKQNEIVETLDKVSGIISHRKEQLKLLDDLIKSRFVEVFGENGEEVPLTDYVWFQEGPGVRSVDFRSEGHILLTGSNINNNEISFGHKSDRFISNKLAEGKYSHFICDEGDILVVTSAIAPDKFDKKVVVLEDEHNYCLNTGIIRFKPNREHLTNGYFREFLKSMYFKRQVMSEMRGIAQMHFGPSHLKKMTILLPDSLEKQIKFEKFVQQVDKLKVEVQKSLDETQLLFDSLMQKYFD